MALGLIGVIDSGPVIALAHAGALPLLETLFDEIVVPAVVWSELTAKADGEEAHALLRLAGARLELPRHPLSDDTADLDPGERHALAAAVALKAMVVLDERNGRRVARKLGLEVRGSLGVLVESKRRHRIATVRPYIEKMMAGGYWLAPELVREVLVAAGEE